MAGRPSRAITLAMVKVLPEPVTPSRVWNTSPSFTPSTSCRIASGWSPAGGYGRNSSKGEPGNMRDSPSGGASLTPSISGSFGVGGRVGRGIGRLCRMVAVRSGPRSAHAGFGQHLHIGLRTALLTNRIELAHQGRQVHPLGGLFGRAAAVVEIQEIGAFGQVAAAFALEVLADLVFHGFEHAVPVPAFL